MEMTLAERVARDALQSFRTMQESEPLGDDAVRRAIRASIFEMPHVDYLSSTLPETGSRRMDLISASNYMCELRTCVGCKSYFTWNGTLAKLDCKRMPGMRMAHTDSFQLLCLSKEASIRSEFTMIPQYIARRMPRMPERTVYHLSSWEDVKRYSCMPYQNHSYLPLFDIYTECIYQRFLPEGKNGERSTMTNSGDMYPSLGPHLGTLMTLHVEQIEPEFIPCILVQLVTPT